MARIEPSPLIADIRGKVGTQIFSRNHYGAYVKAFAVPTGIATARQVSVKGFFATSAEEWRDYPPSIQSRWVQLAESINRKAKRNPHYLLSGYNLFMRCDFYRKMLSLGSVSTPSSTSKNPSVTVTAHTLTALAMSLTLKSSAADSNWRTLIFASFNRNSSVLSSRTPEYKFITSRTLSTSGNVSDIYAAWNLVWPLSTPSPYSFIWFKIQNVNIGNGQTSPAQFIRFRVDP